MPNDLCVTHIADVWYAENAHWQRDINAPRGFDGAVLFVKGEIEYFFPDVSVTAQAGDILLLPGDLPYTGRRHTDEVAFYVLDFTSDTPDAFRKLSVPVPSVYTPRDYASCERQFLSAVGAWRKQTIDCRFVAKSLLFSLLAEASSDNTAADTRTGDMLSFLSERLADPALSVSELCGAFYLSPSQVRRCIFAATGMTPNRYLTRMRIGRAKTLLRTTDMSVTRIASDCGFASPYYFARRFHEETALSPSEYRKRFGGNDA